MPAWVPTFNPPHHPGMEPLEVQYKIHKSTTCMHVGKKFLQVFDSPAVFYFWTEYLRKLNA